MSFLVDLLVTFFTAITTTIEMSFLVDPVMSSITQCLFSCLLDPLTRQIGYLTKLKQNVESLTKQKDKLLALRDDVLQKVEVAQRQQMVPKCKVRLWLNIVEAVQGAVGEIEKQYQHERRCLRAWHSDCWSNYKLGKRVAKMKIDVARLISEGIFGNDVADARLPPPGQMIPSTSAVGVQQVVEKCVSLLQQEEVSTIGLYGIGGVGKTTILKEINNLFTYQLKKKEINELLEGTPIFRVVIYAEVSNNVNVEEIQKVIFKRLGMNWSEDERLEDRAVKILEVIEAVKPVLLLLDNIVDRLDLNAIGVSHPEDQNQCKVVFTTRTEDVCGYMRAQRKIKIEVLGENDAWILFQKNVGDWVLNSPDIQPLAKEVARICGGLPLMLLTVAQSMACKRTVQEWRNTRRELRESAMEFEGTDKLFYVLKYSYDCLKDDTTRLCFLYCSFFPRNWNINIEQVITYWIWEGFFDGNDNFWKTCDLGYEVIRRLKSACLLENGSDESHVKMHDMVREMAQLVSSKFVKKGKFLLQSRSEASSVEKWGEAERAFLMRKRIRELPESPFCPKLSTLMLQKNDNLSNVSETFFQHMQALRVLDLTRTGILHLSRSFCLLENLRYLNLSRTSIRELPVEIEKLIQLQHLDLSETPLESLPQVLQGWGSLQHLDLRETDRLRTIPHTTISKLFGLQELDMRSSFTNWKLKGLGGDGTCAKFQELKSLKHLKILKITITNDHVLQEFFQSKFLLRRAKNLEIKNCDDCSEMPLSRFAKMDVLHTLEIVSCSRLDKFIIGTEVNFLHCLEELWLIDLPNLSIVWKEPMPHGPLRMLRFISIDRCHKLKSLKWVLNLPSLQEINLFSCDEMEDIFGDSEVVEGTILPGLRDLYLMDLPKLKSLYYPMAVLPSLEALTVFECPRLKKLGARSVMQLRKIHGGLTWWEALAWDDELTKQALLPFFLRGAGHKP